MKVLFLSSHIGLGHVTRDLRVKKILINKSNKIDVSWCSTHPVYEYLKNKGEKVLNICNKLWSMTPIAEQYIENRTLFRPDILRRYLKILENNYKILNENIEWDYYDLIYADEFWKIVLMEKFKYIDKLLFATDIIFKPYEYNLYENVISYILNRYFINKYKTFRHKFYIGLLDEVPNQKIFYIYGEYMWRWIKENFTIVGKIPSIEKVYKEYDKEYFKNKLNVEPEYKIITLILGGTKSRSKYLLDKLCTIWKDLREEFDGKLIIILGPRTKYECRDDYIEILNTVYDVGPYLAASDIVISRAGKTTVTDLEYLGIPSIIIPTKGHFEQEWIAKVSSSKYKFIKSLSEDTGLITFRKIIKKLINLTRFKTNINEFRGAEKLSRYIYNMLT